MLDAEFGSSRRLVIFHSLEFPALFRLVEKSWAVSVIVATLTIQIMLAVAYVCYLLLLEN